MPLSDFEWEEEIQEVEGLGRCYVGYAKNDTEQWFRIAIPLHDLEQMAQRKALRNDQIEQPWKRKH